MFSGLVEIRGRLAETIPAGDGLRLRIDAGPIVEGTAIGDSIAVNGCCLTVVAIDGDVLDFEAGRETLARTNLGRQRPGDGLNLERSLRLGDRLGGHLVTGHVDGLGTLDARDDHGAWSDFRIRLDPRLEGHLAEKGSIAVDGVSLTIAGVEPGAFHVALIPHTLAVTTLGAAGVGTVFNLETDLLAKYVESQLRAAGALSPTSGPGPAQ